MPIAWNAQFVTFWLCFTVSVGLSPRERSVFQFPTYSARITMHVPVSCFDFLYRLLSILYHLHHFLKKLHQILVGFILPGC